jgi:hypothetical protein
VGTTPPGNFACTCVFFELERELDSPLCDLQECNDGKWKEAAETAASAPGGILRTQATLTRLQAAPVVPGQKSPLLVYFGALLAKGQLNAVESVEMSRIAISQNKPEMVANWVRENKLTASEPLGDLLKEVRTFVEYHCSSVANGSARRVPRIRA